MIELMVVVIVIAILAVIAIINVQEAQVRAKVSKARGDQYKYWLEYEQSLIDNDGQYDDQAANTEIDDPFSDGAAPWHNGYNIGLVSALYGVPDRWYIWSIGPGKTQIQPGPRDMAIQNRHRVSSYDPSNGTFSIGYIYRTNQGVY